MSGLRRLATAGRNATPAQLLASRSVHVRIQPRPADLSESREILRVLQRFGEISMYKSLKYEYHLPAANISLAIYRDANAAQAALNASPIRFALERKVLDSDAHKTEREINGFELEEDNIEDGKEDDITATTRPPDTLDDILRPSTLATHTLPEQPFISSTPPQPRMPFEPPTTPSLRKVSSKWFQVVVDRSRVIHQDFVERQPYYKEFVPTKSMAQEDLEKLVPHIGLSDVSKRPPAHHRTPNWALKKMNARKNRSESLKSMYEEGGRELREK